MVGGCKSLCPDRDTVRPPVDFFEHLRRLHHPAKYLSHWMRLFSPLLFALYLVGSLGAAPWWESKVISWWYAPDNNWGDALVIVKAHPGLVTSVMNYCGLDVADDGTIIPNFSSVCEQLLPALSALGVQPEVVTNSGNCSIEAFRTLWRDTIISPGVLLDYVLKHNASGLNIDFEPQADNCKGGPSGTAADALLFSTWLHAVREQLTPHGVRLTVDAASWSPVLAQYSVLALGVDRVLTMETYNGGSEGEWMGYFTDFLAHTPLNASGIGLGAWSDGKGAWWETAGAAAYKVQASIAAKVPELAVFRIVPSKDNEWPLAFWWDALKPFVA